MGRAIVEQPNGKFGLWSTVVDDFIIMNGTEEEILTWIGDEAREKAVESWREAFKDLEEKGCGHGIKSWENSLKSVEVVHGKEIVEENIKINDEGGLFAP